MKYRVVKCLWSSESKDKCQAESEFFKKIADKTHSNLCSLSFYKGTKVKGEKMDEW
jgi:hypothetical protein